MKRITLYLVRHGQTFFNRYNRMQGWSDSPLTPKGIADAERAGKELAKVNFAQAYSSDRSRAMDTAKIILHKNFYLDTPYAITPHFREEFYGYFEGEDSPKAWYVAGASHDAKTFQEIITKYSLDASKDFMKEADPFHDAEDAAEYWARVGKGFKQLRAECSDGDKVLMVSHGTTIRSIVGKFGNDQFDVTVSPMNGSITKVILTDEGVTVESYNQLTLQ
ncbi:histidine phosphatase family protein [Latilactobacillus curvatus]|uniref:histidine phosphatase family protein n=1 Tax=Latilactobacillus curvatus TaxID=28038 RepID=UPI0007EB90A7|nr:histidine phosphatase family protein [Latilactobacillus curvatus]ANJ68654.1 fructose-2,6-bisphosphatase [Latilactobacillus curvatus]